MARKKQSVAAPPIQQQQIITVQNSLWKTIISVATGVTAIIVLLITINTIVQPYYAMQTAINDLTAHLREEKREREINDSKIEVVVDDVAVIARVLHLLLLSYTRGDISSAELQSALALYESDVIYGVASKRDDSSQNGDTDQEVIGEITRKTLEALDKLSN